MKPTIDNFDSYELAKVCNYLVEHNNRVFATIENVRAEIFSRAQELKMGEYVATCGFVIMKVKQKAVNGAPAGDFYMVSVHSCALPSRFNPTHEDREAMKRQQQ